jgi:hypothetical protein
MRVAFRTAQESFPRGGNKELPVNWTFTNATGTNIADDLSPEMMASQIESIQSVYIDNSLNSGAVNLTLNGGQVITAQPYTQGIYPVIAAGRISYNLNAAVGSIVGLIFSNTAKPYVVWGPTPGVTVTPPLANLAESFQPLAVGDNVLVAASGIKTVKLYRGLLVFGGGATVQFFDGPSAGALPLTGPMAMFAGGSMTFQPSGIPWIVTSAGNGLILKSDTASNMGGQIGYVQS